MDSCQTFGEKLLVLFIFEVLNNFVIKLLSWSIFDRNIDDISFSKNAINLRYVFTFRLFLSFFHKLCLFFSILYFLQFSLVSGELSHRFIHSFFTIWIKSSLFNCSRSFHNFLIYLTRHSWVEIIRHHICETIYLFNILAKARFLSSLLFEHFFHDG